MVCLIGTLSKFNSDRTFVLVFPGPNWLKVLKDIDEIKPISPIANKSIIPSVNCNIDARSTKVCCLLLKHENENLMTADSDTHKIYHLVRINIIELLGIRPVEF